MFYRLIDRPVSVLAVLAMLVIPGLIVTWFFPVSLLPDIESPVITVNVNAPGMSAMEVNSSLITPLAQHLYQLDGLDDMECRSVSGNGIITLRFGHGGANSNMRFIDVNEQIDRAMSYWPGSVERPLVARSDVSDIPSLFINVTGKESVDIASLSDLVSNVISRRIEQLPQIAMVDMSGLARSAVTIVPDRSRMMALGITDAMLAHAVSETGMDVGYISVKDGGMIYEIQFESSVADFSDIPGMWLNVNGRLFRLSDLAKVTETILARDGVVQSDGKDAVSMALVKNRNCGMGELRKALEELISSFEEDYPELDFTITRDQTGLLDFSILNMLRNLVSGALFACVVLFFFYRNMQAPLLTLISVPVSLAISSLLMYVAGISVNIISLSGLVLGIGLMVDNSIIAVGNISRRHRGGESLRDACVLGTREVFTPLLSSLLTTCALFLPLSFLSGTAGALFHDEALSVTITLTSSLAVSMLVLPLLYRMLNRKVPDVRSFPSMHALYLRIINVLFRNRWTMAGIFILSMAVMAYVIPRIPMKRMPDMTRTETLLMVDWNRNISADESARICSDVCSLTHAGQFTVMSGPQTYVLSHTPSVSGNSTLVYMKCRDRKSLDTAVEEIVESLERKCPSVTVQSMPAGNVMDMLFPDYSDNVIVHLKPKSYDDGMLMEHVDSIAGKLSVMYPHSGITLPRASSLLVVETDLNRLETLGLSPGDLSLAISDRLGDHQFMNIQHGSSSLPVMTVSGHDESFLTWLSSGTVRNHAGAEIPVREVASAKWRSVPEVIYSGLEGDYIPIGADPRGKVPAFIHDVRRIVAEDGYFELGFTGRYFSGNSLSMELLMVLAVSVLLLYLVLAAQFSSLVQPLVVMSELLVDISFVLAVLYLCGESLNAMSMTGIIVMCGIAINDSILKVDTINRLISSGKSPLRAAIEAGKLRNGSVVMTSVTTILAVVPFLVRGDMGSDLQYPLSLAVISGMFMGTFMSIFVVPVSCCSIAIKNRRAGLHSSARL